MGGFFGLIGSQDAHLIRRMSDRAFETSGYSRAVQVSETGWFGMYWDSDVLELDRHADQVAIACARVANGPQLRIELEHAGCGFRSGSDIELLLSAYRRFGTDCFQLFEGELACAIWDERRATLVLARDRLGHYPLYYWEGPGLLAFASEYKILLALEQVPSVPDRSMIQRLQDAKYLPAHRTLLSDVMAVPPSHWVELGFDRRSQQRYWEPRVEVRSGSETEFAGRIREQLLETVERQIRPYDVVGVNLSSGVDSAAVLAAIKQVRPAVTVHTFTAGHGTRDGDMLGAEQMAHHFGTIHHSIEVDSTRLPRVLPHLVWLLEDPIGRSELVHNYELALLARRHVPVVLGGYGSDVLFGGTPKDKIIKLIQWLPALKRPLSEFYNYTQISREPTSLVGRALKTGYFRRSERPAPVLLGSPERSEPWQLIEATSETFNHYLLDGLHDPGWLQKDLRLHLTQNLDILSPFFDGAMIQLAFQVPARYKIRRWREKHILREAVRPWLPGYALQRPKYPHRMGCDLTFSQVFEGFAREVLTPEAVRARGFFCPAEVMSILRRPAWRPYPFSHAMRIWTMVVTELWAQIFLDRRGELLLRSTAGRYPLESTTTSAVLAPASQTIDQFGPDVAENLVGAR